MSCDGSNFLLVVKDDAYDVGANDLEYFQKASYARFNDEKNEFVKDVDMNDSKTVENVVNELVPEMTSDVIMSSVVLEHWEENILWDESDKKPQLNSVKLAQK